LSRPKLIGDIAFLLIAKSIPNGDIAEMNKTQQSAADHESNFDIGWSTRV
jgi:hypothetical protein